MRSHLLHPSDKLDSHLSEIAAYDTIHVTEADATGIRFMRKHQRFNRITDTTMNEALRDLAYQTSTERPFECH